MTRVSAIARLIYIAVTVALTGPISAQTGAWTSPVVLSAGGQGWEATAAIDGSGNSLALWDERTTQDQIWSRSEASGGNWGSVSELSRPSRQPLSCPPFESLRQDLPRQCGVIKAACGQPIARPHPNGNLLNF